MGPPRLWRFGTRLHTPHTRPSRYGAAHILHTRAVTVVDVDQAMIGDHLQAALTRAHRLLANGELDAAQAELDIWLAEDHDHAGLHYLHGCVCFERGDHVRAVGALRRAAALSPEHVDIQHALGRALGAQGASHEALVWLDRASLARPDLAALHVARGDVLVSVARSAEAERAYRQALACNPTEPGAHLGLSTVRFEGRDYLGVLEDLHAALVPRTYLEIGVETGRSLRLAASARRAIGIDPEPKLAWTLGEQTRVLAETSDEFFGSGQADAYLGDRELDLVFLDGLHRFEQALRDFINVERHATATTIVAIHDCAPIDAVSSARVRRTAFWSGDVWKLVACLREYRPDLEVVTLAAAPTGLALVRGLDPEATMLAEHYDEVVRRYIDLGYDDIAGDEVQRLGLVPSEPGFVERWIGCAVAA